MDHQAKVYELFTTDRQPGEDHPSRRGQPRRVIVAGTADVRDYRFLTGVRVLSIVQTRMGNLVRVRLAKSATAREVVALERHVRFLLGTTGGTDVAMGTHAEIELPDVVAITTSVFMRMQVGDPPFARAFHHPRVPTGMLRLQAPEPHAHLSRPVALSSLR
ncbi:hypothetical protein HYW18_03445 [Candidatus Uhrbacteria bacterium]|nr:hypothetical protein [Candidatus Uhrbacteria bacterium]